jgi:peptidoglycan-associated lipoprotein
MSETFGGSPRVLILFALVSVLLTGCPKSPSPGAGMGAGSTAGGGAAGSAGGAGGAGNAGSAGGTGAGAGSTLQAGGTGAQGGQGTGMSSGTTGSGRATGTNIPALPSPAEFSTTSALRDVHFAFDKYDITPSEKTVLDTNARWLKSHAKALVLIEGHCDERGTNEYNLALGERRAKAARDYLASAGVPDSRITVVSYGEERPICSESTEACWAQNRRAHFLVKE